MVSFFDWAGDSLAAMFAVLVVDASEPREGDDDGGLEPGTRAFMINKKTLIKSAMRESTWRLTGLPSWCGCTPTAVELRDRRQELPGDQSCLFGTSSHCYYRRSS